MVLCQATAFLILFLVVINFNSNEFWIIVEWNSVQEAVQNG